MEHIAAVLLIIGCSNDLSQCRELPAPGTIFETADECMNQRPFVLNAMEGKAERVLGTCIAVDPALEEEEGELVWSVNPDGSLDAAFEMPPTVVASNSLRQQKDYLSQE